LVEEHLYLLILFDDNSGGRENGDLVEERKREREKRKRAFTFANRGA